MLLILSYDIFYVFIYFFIEDEEQNRMCMDFLGLTVNRNKWNTWWIFFVYLFHFKQNFVVISIE